MPSVIQPHELQLGDVLLYSSRSLLSRLIKLFDGGDYNHSALYDGQQVAESVEDGITARSLSDSTTGFDYVDVFRFRSDNGARLGDEELPADPVKARIDHYLANRERYAYEQLILLGVLAATRQIPLSPYLSMVLRVFLESAADRVASIVAVGREPMICSEFVYRCYQEAGERYRIRIVGADIRSGYAFLPPHAPSGTPIDLGVGSPEARSFQAAAKSFLVQFELTKSKALPSDEALALTSLPPFASPTLTYRTNPDFVTPHDLQDSPSLNKVGRLAI
jgi:hypothetical protein